MRPKKAKELLPIVAKEADLPLDVVSTIVNYYWQDVRKSLSDLKHTRVHLVNLGDFVLKHWKLDDKITSLEQFEETNRQKGLQQMTARFKTAESLFGFKNLKVIVEEESQRAEFIKTHKKIANESKK